MDARERERLERDLDLACELQMRLVPSVGLTAGPWEVCGRVVQARHATDYYDYFLLGGGRFGVTIARVWGQGLPAAMRLSQVHAFLRAVCDDRELREVIRFVNHGLAALSVAGPTMLFYGEVEPERGVLSYINAGHSFPMLRRRDGAIQDLIQGGPPLGLIPNAEYERGEAGFAPGDVLLLYSDGISHATNISGNQFGEDRVGAVFQNCHAHSPDEIIGCLLEAVDTFCGSAGRNDDMTAVVVGPRTGAKTNGTNDRQ